MMPCLHMSEVWGCPKWHRTPCSYEGEATIMFCVWKEFFTAD